MSAFHWRDGWTFTRLDGGMVEIRVGLGDRVGDESLDAIHAIIPAAEWASIVHAVAAPGSDYYAIKHTHDGTRVEPQRVS